MVINELFEPEKMIAGITVEKDFFETIQDLLQASAIEN